MNDDRSTKEKVQDTEFEELADAVFDRHYAMVALVTLCPKKGETWTEERMMLWVEIVEKTARLIYGLPSEWDHMRVVVHESLEDHDDPPSPTLEPTETVEPPARSTEPPEPAPAPGRSEPRQWENGELDEAVLELLARSSVTLKRREIAERLGANDNTMTDVLARLRAAGKIKRLGVSSDTTYDLVASSSCQEPDCILAAFPGSDRCELHRAKVAVGS